MTTQKRAGSTQADRRRFLKSMLVTGGATAVAVATGRVAAAPEATSAVPAAAPAPSKGYRLTEHVAAYYRTAQL